MILLAGSTHQLQVVTGSALANTEVHASWVDNGTTPAPGVTDTVITTAATTSVAGSPIGAVVRNVKTLTIRNTNASAQTVTVQHSNGTIAVSLRSVSLAQGEVLEYDDNVGWCVYDATGAVRTANSQASRFIQATRLSNAVNGASGTFTTSALTNKIRLRMVGGGGGGGGGAPAVVAGGASSGAGGGAGAFGEWIIPVTPSTGYAWALGAGGTAGAIGATGGAGGASTLTIAGTVYTCSAGSGGASIGTAAATAATADGGNGGAAATGGTPLISQTGPSGSYAARSSGTVCVSGEGGTSPFGAGGKPVSTQGNGLIGSGPGAGGSGGTTLNGGATQIGGAGVGGGMVVEEYT